MLATINSMVLTYRGSFSLSATAALAILAIVSSSTICAGAEVSSPVKRIQSLFSESKEKYEANKTDFDAVCQFARAAFDWADYCRDSDRADIANEGIAASRQAIGLKGSAVQGHYYLALNLGQLARTKSLGALRIVKEMEIEFKRAIEIEGGFDYAGPHRSLGILYVEAPGWPTSIGNKTKGRDTLAKAVQLHPEFPDNQISFAEALLKTGDKKTVAAKIPEMQRLIETARKILTGDAWTQSWIDWDKRWQQVRSLVRD